MTAMTEITSESVKKDPEEPEEADFSPFAPFQMMESLLEKLKSLDYEQQYCRRMRLKGFSKVYFAVPTNPGEQFNSFVSLAAWLIDQSGGSMEQPQEYDDPNATIANVLESLRGLGYSTEFPPSKLKSGCGGPCIRVLDLLASAAVKNKKLRFELPQFSQDEADDPGVEECTHSDDDEDLVEWTTKRSSQRSRTNRAGGFICDSETDAEVIDDDEATTETTDDSLVDPHGLFGSLLTHAQLGGHFGASEIEGIMEPGIDRGDWQLEVERVLPQLRVAIRTEAKDWRSHLEQMTRHKTEIETCFSESKGHLQRLQEDLSRSLDKIGSREKYINSQVDQLLTEYRCAQVSSLPDFFHVYLPSSIFVCFRSRNHAFAGVFWQSDLKHLKKLPCLNVPLDHPCCLIDEPKICQELILKHPVRLKNGALPTKISCS
ncbi:unnamed protein product [Schistocephalus solidus]|uniref:Intraflagellar transport protein 57 homolog n=1 Tax=Schistocephalus solidus TaxID=70667 RepID=A0A183THF6_SCHSO|nr:unnamed protein product [Schistocephalus solidus]